MPKKTKGLDEGKTEAPDLGELEIEDVRDRAVVIQEYETIAKGDDEEVVVANGDRKTEGLPKTEDGKVYLVTDEVYFSNPGRDDLARVKGDKVIVKPKWLRMTEESEEVKEKYPRWSNCPSCGSQMKINRWGDSYGKVRRIVQLNKRCEAGLTDHITIEAPDIKKELDLVIRGDEIVFMESEYSDDEEELKYDVREM